MKDYILEVCADSVESVLAAEEGGATRVELCQNLVIGGTTPGAKFFEEVRRHSKIRIHALIRPRFGDFCYTDYEYAVIREEVKMYRELGAEGVVIGILKPDGTLNMEQMEGLMEEARQVLQDAVEDCLMHQRNADWSKIKLVIRDTMNEFIWKRTKRKPMILPIIMDV